jgi:hypothetical protein
MKKVTYILIPGLWDQKPIFGWFYYAVGKWWGLHGMRTVVCKMNWISVEPYQKKLERLGACIDQQRQQGRGVVLVGVSAGGPMAVLGLIEFDAQVSGAVSVSGLLALTEKDKKQKVYTKTSWFKAAQALERQVRKLTSSQRRRIMTIGPLKDDMIDLEREKIEGVRHKRIAARGHMPGVITALIVHPLKIRRFARRLHR